MTTGRINLVSIVRGPLGGSKGAGLLGPAPLSSPRTRAGPRAAPRATPVRGASRGAAARAPLLCSWEFFQTSFRSAKSGSSSENTDGQSARLEQGPDVASGGGARRGCARRGRARPEAFLESFLGREGRGAQTLSAEPRRHKSRSQHPPLLKKESERLEGFRSSGGGKGRGGSRLAACAGLRCRVVGPARPSAPRQTPRAFFKGGEGRGAPY